MLKALKSWIVFGALMGSWLVMCYGPGPWRSDQGSPGPKTSKHPCAHRFADGWMSYPRLLLTVERSAPASEQFLRLICGKPHFGHIRTGVE
jgi:hypothetical protein